MDRYILATNWMTTQTVELIEDESLERLWAEIDLRGKNEPRGVLEELDHN